MVVQAKARAGDDDFAAGAAPTDKADKARLDVGWGGV
jgi:hypothetical protein